MKRISFRMMLLLMGVLVISLSSCKKEDEQDKPEGSYAKFLIGTTVKNPDGMSGSSYMQLINKLEGSIDNSKAKQIAFGIGFGVRGNDIYLYPSFGKDGDPNLVKYKYNGTNHLSEPQKLNLPPNIGVSNIIVVNDEKAFLPAYNIGKLFIINQKAMTVLGEIDLSKYAYNDNSPEPANGIIRDGFLYLCLDQVGSSYMPYPDHRQVDVLVIDVKTDKVVKMISETASNLSFPTRPMDATSGMIFTDEANNIYITCVGNFGYDPSYMNNGFVCIPAGKQEFDTSKSWDISQTSIQGTKNNSKPASVYNTLYIGGGKAVAFVGLLELIDPKNPYTSRNSIAVLIDFNAKTIKRINGIPATDGHSICLRKYKDLVVIGAYGEKEVGFFTFNPQTDEVKHVLTTVGNPMDFHYFKWIVL